MEVNIRITGEGAFLLGLGVLIWHLIIWGLVYSLYIA